MIRFVPFLAAAAVVLLLGRPALAAGGVLTTPGERVGVVDVRYAMAMSAAQTTRWASLRVARFPGAMAWILPVRPGARVEEVGEAWLEALELATAPRIVSPGCADGGASSPKTIIERRPPLGTGVRSLRSATLDDVTALRTFAQSWGFDLPPEMDARCEEVTARGFMLLALVYGGPSDANATRTVRITDDAFPWVPLLLTAAGDDPVQVTTFIFADTRTRLGPGPELEVESARIARTNGVTTNYAAEVLALLLGSHGSSWIVETAGHDVLFEGAPGPAGVDPTPALAPTYFRLAAGDDHTDASDLTVALSGIDLSAAWITRMSGLVPPRAFGDDLAVTRRDAQRKSPFLVASLIPPTCPVPDGGRVGPGGGPGGPVQPPSPPPPSVPPLDPLPPPPPPNWPPPASVGMSCSCSPGPGDPAPPSSDDSCDGSDPGTTTSEPDEGCDGSADDTSGESCDGSADDSYDSSDDGCDGSSSSGSGSDDGCSSGSPEGGDGCSSSSGSTSRSEGCTTARNAFASTRARRTKPSRTRISITTLTLVAVALVLRRTSRRRCSTSSAARLDGS